jgi:hypothetical protein
VVTNESAEFVVDTREHAVDVAGLLNWCGVHELEPVPELAPRQFRAATPRPRNNFVGLPAGPGHSGPPDRQRSRSGACTCHRGAGRGRAGFARHVS